AAGPGRALGAGGAWRGLLAGGEEGGGESAGDGERDVGTLRCDQFDVVAGLEVEHPGGVDAGCFLRISADSLPARDGEGAVHEELDVAAADGVVLERGRGADDVLAGRGRGDARRLGGAEEARAAG